MLDIAAACLVVTALLAYLNHRFVRLPTTIGVMVIALVLSLVIVGLDIIGVSHALRRYEESLLRSIDFSDVLIQGMLSLVENNKCRTDFDRSFPLDGRFPVPQSSTLKSQ